MMWYLLDSIALNPERVAEDTYMIRLSNGAEITVVEHPEHNGNVWAWKVDTQIFSDDWGATSYLKKLIYEKLTSKRIIYHAKKEVPDICGTNGAGCRNKGKCNRALCSHCPVAEAFFAEQDGVELIYAVEAK